MINYNAVRQVVSPPCYVVELDPASLFTGPIKYVFDGNVAVVTSDDIVSPSAVLRSLRTPTCRISLGTGPVGVSYTRNYLAASDSGSKVISASNILSLTSGAQSLASFVLSKAAMVVSPVIPTSIYDVFSPSAEKTVLDFLLPAIISFWNTTGKQEYLDANFSSNPRLIPTVPGTYLYWPRPSDPDIVIRGGIDVCVSFSLYGAPCKVTLKGEPFAFYLHNTINGTAELTKIPVLPMTSNYLHSPVGGGYEMITSASINSSTAYTAFDGLGWLSSWSVGSIYSLDTSPTSTLLSNGNSVKGEYIQLQTNRAIRPNTIAVSTVNVGSASVLGSIDGRSWSLLCSVSPKPVIDWIAALRGTGTSEQTAFGIAAFPNGDMVVIGTCNSFVITCTGAGVPISTVTSSSAAYDIFAARYTSTGDVVWSAMLVTSTANKTAPQVCTLSNGGFAIIGYSTANVNVNNVSGSLYGTLSSSANSHFIVVYDASGNVQWMTRCNGVFQEFSAHTSWQAAITSTIEGGLAVCGTYSSNPLTVFNANNTQAAQLTSLTGVIDGYIARFSPSGMLRWVARQEVDDVRHMIEMSDGSLVGCGSLGIGGPGRFYSSSGVLYGTEFVGVGLNTNDMFLVSYSVSGAVQWATTVAGSSYEAAVRLVRTTNDMIVMGTGCFSTSINVRNANGTNYTGPSFVGGGGVANVIVAYSAAGMVQFVAWVIAANNDVQGLVALPNGGFAVFGTATGTASVYNGNGTLYGTLSSTGVDSYIVGYNARGFVIWAMQTSGSANDYVRSAALFKDGTLATCGYFSSSTLNAIDYTGKTSTLTNTGGLDAFIIKYNINGNPSVQDIPQCDPNTHFRIVVTSTSAAGIGQVSDVSISGPAISEAFVTQNACQPINTIACGNGHAFGITQNGTLIGMLTNSYGQTGVDVAAVSDLSGNTLPTYVLTNSTYGRVVKGVSTSYSNVSLFVDSLQNLHVYRASAGYITTCLTGSGSLAQRQVSQAVISPLATYGIILDTTGQVHGFTTTTTANLASPTSVYNPMNITTSSSTSLSTATIASLCSKPGTSHVLALDTLGRVHAWGSNTNGQIGVTGTTFSSTNTTLVATGSLAGLVVRFVTANGNQSYAIDSTGGLHAWGSNATGLLGTCDTGDKTAPVRINNIVQSSLYGRSFTAVDGGGDSNNSFTMAIDTLGHLHFWGDPGTSLGSPAWPVLIPVNLSIDNRTALFRNNAFIATVSCGNGVALARDATGKLYVWQSTGIYPTELTNMTIPHAYTIAGPGTNEPAPLSTGNFGANANVPLEFSASSEITGTNDAYRAFGIRGFNDERNNMMSHWASAYDKYNTTTGAYTGTISTNVSGTSVLGEWVQCRLPKHALRLASGVINDAGTGIASGILAGSTDSGNTWVRIGTFACPAALPVSVPAVLSLEIDAYFNAFRIIVQSTSASSVRPISQFLGNATVKDCILTGTIYDCMLPRVPLTSNVGEDTACMYRVTSSSNSNAAYLAFDRLPSTEWRSNGVYSTSTGAYTSTTGTLSINAITYTGEWIQLDLGMQCILNGITIMSGSVSCIISVFGICDNNLYLLVSSVSLSAGVTTTIDTGIMGTDVRIHGVRIVVTSVIGNAGYASIGNVQVRCTPVAPGQSFYCRSSWVTEAGSMIANCAAVTSDGGCIVAGVGNADNTAYSANGNTSVKLTSIVNDGILVKYTSAGDVAWNLAIKGSGYEFITDLVNMPDGGCIFVGGVGNSPNSLVDTLGNSYSFSPSPGMTNGMACRLSSGGAVLWACRFNATGFTYTDRAMNWTTGVQGNTGNYATCTGYHAGSNSVFVAGKYLNELVIYGSNGVTMINLNGTMLSSSGKPTSFLACYDGSGAIQWATKYGGTTDDGHVRAMAVGPEGHVFICMEGSSTVTSQNCVAYSSTGTAFGTYMTRNYPYQMLARYNRTGGVDFVGSSLGIRRMVCSPVGYLYAICVIANASDQIYDVANNAFNNVFPSGQSMAALIQYTANGAIAWASVSHGVRIVSLIASMDNGAIVHYQSVSSSSPMRFYHACNNIARPDMLYEGSVLVKYNASGTIEWISRASAVTASGVSVYSPVNGDIPIVMNSQFNARPYVYFTEPNATPGASLQLSSNNGITSPKTVLGLMPGAILPTANTARFTVFLPTYNYPAGIIANYGPEWILNIDGRAKWIWGIVTGYISVQNQPTGLFEYQAIVYSYKSRQAILRYAVDDNLKNVQLNGVQIFSGTIGTPASVSEMSLGTLLSGGNLLSITANNTYLRAGLIFTVVDASTREILFASDAAYIRTSRNS